MTWHSEDDFIKDITSMDDFGSQEIAQRILTSCGRGEVKRSEQEYSSTFLDTSSGEPNVVTDEYISFLDFCPRNAGRGKVLRSYLKSKMQLKEQLRLARPLGSSDLIIEAYFNRFAPKPNKTETATTSEVNAETSEACASTSNSDSNPKTVNPRIKATRNSKLQSNALIDGLLKKISTEKEDQNSINNEKKNHESSDEYNQNENGCSSSSSSNLPDKNDEVTKSDIKKCEDLRTSDENSRMPRRNKVGKDVIDNLSRLKLTLKKIQEMELSSKEVEKSQEKVNDQSKLSEPLTPQEVPENIQESYNINNDNFPPLRRNRRRRN